MWNDHRHLLSASCFPVLLLLGNCAPKVECDSPEARNAVLAAIADDHNNKLVTFAARNSDVAKGPSDSSAKAERAKPFYRLGETIVTVSTSDDRRTLGCSGGISVVVGDTRASKEINFTVQRSVDGKMSVSVNPFQFDPNSEK
jgi:hypothetical protein